MAKVSILDFEPGKHFEKADIESAILGSETEIQLIRARDAQSVLQKIIDSDVIIVWSRFELHGGILRQLKACKGVVCASVGYDHIDLKAAAELGIQVCNVPDYGTEEVADHTLALLLNLVRHISHLNGAIRQSIWDWKVAGPVRRLRGQRLGLVGFGRIGSAVGRRAQAFGLDVSFYDPHIPWGIEKAHAMRRFEQLSELLADSDIISLHAPHTPETHGLMNAVRFEEMKAGALLINTARGHLVQNKALINALDSGKLAGAALDVLESEPQVPEALLTSDAVILTPHSAWCSTEGFLENREKAALAAKAIQEGRLPRNLIHGV